MIAPCLTDFDDHLNTENAAAELRRAERAEEAGDTGLMLAWARKWGRPAIEFIQSSHDTPPRGSWGGDD